MINRECHKKTDTQHFYPTFGNKIIMTAYHIIFPTIVKNYLQSQNAFKQSVRYAFTFVGEFHIEALKC